ncbi:MAG: bifunctional oligoribonuclease/PAP phosphatase NrnA [Candidatus Spechtbacterales bacterium]|nr:bifunctional oligoribonuclease/PAP phosphatase NrnA [Candidatus Spechtbacterales bacterium]
MPSAIKEKFQTVKHMIEDSEYILLAGHKNPDGDSLGSLLALHLAISENLGKNTIPYMTDKEVPQSLDFLPDKELLNDKISWYPDLVIGVDYGDFSRLNLPEDIAQGARIITFDHHPYSGQRGDVQIIETQFSSTAELVYHFLREVNWHISKRTALCLLTGILTDTGAFAHNTSARTVKVAGELLEKGAPLHAIHSKTFAGKRPEVLNIWGNILQKMKTEQEYNFSHAIVSFDEFKKFGIVLDDFTGLISVMNTADETDFSILAIEYERGKIKGSLRSDKFKDIDVSRIAEALGGGGHKYAAGFSLECSAKEAKEKIFKAVQNSLQKVRN